MTTFTTRNLVFSRCANGRGSNYSLTGIVFAGKRTTGGIRRAGNPHDGVFDREVPKYTQIGNAVPIGLAEQVGLHFKKSA